MYRARSSLYVALDRESQHLLSLKQESAFLDWEITAQYPPFTF
jgi:hypothetical protein